MWIADSGATEHFCIQKRHFIDYVEDPHYIKTGNGSALSPGKGSVPLKLKKSSGKLTHVVLTNVRHMPNSFVNTISEDLLEDHGVTWNCLSQTFIDFRTGQEFAKITKQGRLRFFSLENSHDQGSALAATNADLGVDLNTLHQRFGHLHIEGVKELMIQNNIKLLNQRPFEECEACRLAKSTKIITKVSPTRATFPFERVHVDTCGKITVEGIGGKQYYVIFTDDFSRYRWVSAAAGKEDIFNILRIFVLNGNQISL